jgi:hypothetical protein
MRMGWNSRPTSRRLLSSSPSGGRGGHYWRVLLLTDCVQGMERWHERVGGDDDGSEGRDSTRDTEEEAERARERERERDTDRDTDTETRRHARDTVKSLENPGPRPPRRRAKSGVDSPRHRDDSSDRTSVLLLSHGQRPMWKRSSSAVARGCEGRRGSAEGQEEVIRSRL